MKIAPSILSADFAKLGQEVTDIVEAGADYLHIDIMDGQFVPNISFGPMVVKAIRPLTDITFDVHLMINEPEQYLEVVADAGADIITVHAESTKHIHRAIQLIKKLGCKAGVVISPGTPVEMLKPVLDIVDLVLIMTVNPGYGNQTFLETMLVKVKKLNQLRDEHGYHYEIEVDGGVDNNTAPKCIEAGADVLVSGSYVFESEDRQAAIESLKG